MTSKFTTVNGTSYAVGTISVPDSNPGIQGVKQVPKGAQIVAALLYWQTVEKVGVTMGGAGSGQNGYFRPVFTGGPAAPGYAISGTNLTSPGNTSVSWSSGGCSGGSTGKLLRTYRADVAGGLPVDGNGNSLANGSFEVRLPSSGNATPLTLGATLVIIYRIPAGANGPNVPLNSIVIYDGDYGQSSSQLTMTQQLQGFYQADHNPVSKLTQIVGSGQSNKFQTVYLGSGANQPVALPFPYGNRLPAFPGWYGTWDNPTWTFSSASTNPIKEDSSFATTQVVPSSSMQGCVSWGAVILSTTVKNSDKDGILDSWKTDQGYCDAAFNNGVCTKHSSTDPAWVDLTGATGGQKDIFLQYDYMCSSISQGQCVTGGNNYSFDPRLAVDPADNGKTAVDKVVDAFNNRPANPKRFVLHAIPGKAILEGQPNVSCADTDASCTFPNEPGTVGFREGLSYIKNQTIDPGTGVIGCDPATNTNCVAVFTHGKKDSYHYALFSHGVGLPNWFLSDQSLASVTQSGSTVTFTTSSAHGISPIAGDSVCSAAKGFIGRVTVVFAITNPNLNGTYCAKAVGNPAAANKFSLTLTNSSTTASYTKITDPNLAVANGQVTSMSGYSDVGGQNSVISLGYGGWGPPNDPAAVGNKWQMKAGTFMHELGHTLGLSHGGTFYKTLGSNPPDYTPTFEVNCKPNVQSIMSYVFQFDLLKQPGTGTGANNPPVYVVDFSEDPQGSHLVNTLTESSPQPTGFLSNLTYANTSWFQKTAFSGAAAASGHCDGSSKAANELYSYKNDAVSNFFWNAATGSDLNFNGAATDVMHPHNEWEGSPAQNGAAPSPGVDLQQISAVGTISTVGPGGEAGGLKPAGGGGGLKPAGGGGGLHPAGGGGGLKPAGGGGGLKPAGGGGLSSDITHEAANSYARPPDGLFIVQEEASPRNIDLSWFAPSFGQVLQYNVYRSDAGGPFNKLNPGPGTQTTFTDTVNCNAGGYRYRVTSVISDDKGNQLESVPSNTVPASGEPLLTGCYVVPSFAPAVSNGVQAESVKVAWTLHDDFYVMPPAAWASAQQNVGVTNNNLAANTLYAVGPVSTDQCVHVTQGRTLLVDKGVPQITGDVFNNAGAVFTFTWNSTDSFCAGSYKFELDLDSGQTFTSSAVQLDIDINDTNSTPHVTTVALPSGIVGKAYSDTLTEDGGTAPFAWNVTGLPSGISQQPPGSATISGTACVAGPNTVMATVMDSATPKNSGSQGFTLQINKATTTTGVSSDANPSVFQQPVTFTVTITPQYGCVPTGTVTLSDGATQIGTKSLSGGTAAFTFATLSVGVHSFTASYGGDANFNASDNISTPLSQTVNKASTATALTSILPATVFVGQPVTVSFTFGVVAPGGNSPIAPTANITVLASDGSTCVASPTLGGALCTLSPAPATAGHRTFAITYPGDGNFLMSGANGSYDVYKLVFTTQPSNTGAGLAITPAVAVTAEDSNNGTLTTFTGGVTLAIGSGTGTLSGTTTQSAVAGVATFNDLSINKIANGYTLTASPAGGVPDATSNAFNIDTFYVDAGGNFGTLDLATGTAAPIGTTPVTGSTGIDLTPALQVYEYDTSNQLMQITPSSGAAALVGTGTLPNPNNTKTGGLSTGSYFAIDTVTGNLYSVDLSSGATSSLGTTSTTLVPTGCGFEATLAGPAGVLYYTIGSQDTGAGCSAFPDTLYRVDPTNGSTTSIGQITINGIAANGFTGSTFVGGTLYGFTSDGKEYTIDTTAGPTAGAANFVANTTISGTNTAVAIVGAGSQ